MSSIKGLGPLESSLLAETIPKTQYIPQTPDVPQPSDVSEDYEVIIPCKTSAADPTAVTLPLHSTPMGEVPEERGSIRMQYETPVVVE